MSSSALLSVVTFIYGLAACLYIGSSVFKKPGLVMAGFWVGVAAVIGNSAGIIMRWVESYRMGIGHAPLSNMYESLIFFSWTIGLLYIILERKYRIAYVGAYLMPLICLAMAYAAISPDRIQPLIPALKSNWLIAHVVTCFLGYAAFAIGFILSLIFLIKNSSSKPGSDIKSKLFFLEELTYQMVIFGFLFLSIGIITGAVWANSAWGSYWSWDPKETWSLITWFIYAALIHAKRMRGWRGKRIAWLSALGFAAVLFTYFGVNYLPGLHSYGA